MGVVPTPLLNLRVDAARKARWVAAATAAGQKLSEWIRDVADAAAAIPDSSPHPPPVEKRPPVAKGQAPVEPPAERGPVSRLFDQRKGG